MSVMTTALRGWPSAVTRERKRWKGRPESAHQPRIQRAQEVGLPLSLANAHSCLEVVMTQCICKQKNFGIGQ
jgi:hypothetical protein